MEAAQQAHMDAAAAEGLAEQKIARISTPAGLDLGAATPEEIALSIMGHIVAVRRGGTGRPLQLKGSARSQADDFTARHAADRVISQCDVPAKD